VGAEGRGLTMAAITSSPPVVVIPSERAGAFSVGVQRFVLTLGRALLSVVLILVIWQLLLLSWGENLAFTTRGPIDVWRFAFGADTPPEVRQRILSNLWITLGDAGLGLLVGTLGAIAMAFAFNLFRPLEQAFMPVAMVLRSVPLVAMTPLMATVFGRGLVSVAMVGAIVTFFPTLVNVTLGLRGTPQQSVDLVKAYGANRLYTLSRIQFPNALPQLFAALRASAPLAITGAMLAEFLLTGKGLGNTINVDRNQFKYDSMWTQAALATLASVLVYSIFVGIEGSVLARFAPDRAKASKVKA